MFGGGLACRIPAGKDSDDHARPLRCEVREFLGIDSPYDYDAVLEKCREIGMAPTFHAGGRGFGLQLARATSPSTISATGPAAEGGQRDGGTGRDPCVHPCHR